MILSSSSSSSSYILLSTSRARVSSPLLVAASKLSFFAARRSSRVVFCASKAARSMAEMVEEMKDSSATVTAAAAASTAASSSSAASEEKPELLSHSPTFLDLRSEEDLLAGIQNEAEAGNLPSRIAQGMEELYHNYRNAIFQSGHPKADEVVLSNMAVALDCILKDVKEPFEFSPYHKAIREPFDYYMFGQNYIRPLVDFRSSYVGNISLFSEMEEKLQKVYNLLFLAVFEHHKNCLFLVVKPAGYITPKLSINLPKLLANGDGYQDPFIVNGENVVLMSNHQTEADPAVIALLLESTNPYLAENMIYVAGDRVITDPLCKPFSMGRNLLCVYSKKHMYDIPELVETKKRANTRSLKEMALLLRGGSKIIWIAPSGGRDRPDFVTNEWYPAPFDASSADNMRRLVEHAGVPGHIYPLAILCYDIMPPPTQVEKEIGEKRVISFHGTGISVAPEISLHEVAGALENTEETKMVYSRALYDSVNQQYNVLKSAIHGKQGLKATTPTVSLSQPWK